VRNSKGERLLVRPRGRWEDNIKVNLRAIIMDGVGCIRVAQGRDQWRGLANTVINFRFHMLGNS
jgi:hypothetical protein